MMKVFAYMHCCVVLEFSVSEEELVPQGQPKTIG